MFSGGCRGTGATLIGARVTGVGATSGFSVDGVASRVHGAVGAESVSSVGGGGGGGGGGGSGGGRGAFVGVG